MATCDFDDCSSKATLVSRLSPNGYLVSSGKKAYSFREAYERFNYCRDCHDNLMKEAWNRVRSSGSKMMITLPRQRFRAAYSSNTSLIRIHEELRKSPRMCIFGREV